MRRYSSGLVSIIMLMNVLGFHLTVNTEYTFTRTSSAALIGQEFRVATTGWSDVSSVVVCAWKTASTCPGSRGFLYASVSGVCTPLLWLHKGSGTPSKNVPSGTLYLITVICPEGYQGVEYGEKGRSKACLRKIGPPLIYNDAVSQCSSLGGKLASVKTASKLAMVAAQAQGQDLWVGLDDQAKQGEFIWQEDGQQLTAGEIQAVFLPGEPSRPDERCVHYKAEGGGLNDFYCSQRYEALCQFVPPCS